MTGAPSGTCPLPTGQACPGNPLAGYSFQPGPGRGARSAWADPN